MLSILRDIASVLRLIRDNPLFSRPQERWDAFGRFLAWQLIGRAHRGAVCMDYVNHSRLLVRRRLGGRLHYVLRIAEFNDMAFVAHLLREGEVFADVGANIGAYTVMATVCSGAHSIAFEPEPRAFGFLLDNIALNRLQDRTEAVQAAVGARPGQISLTSTMGELNHVRREGEACDSISARMVSLDAFFSDRATPVLIKIDVEGFETEVIEGCRSLLTRLAPLALVMENAGNGAQYGYDEAELHAGIVRMGYAACSYDALNRTLTALEGGPVAHESSNILYVRDITEARRRLHSAQAFMLGTKKI